MLGQFYNFWKQIIRGFEEIFDFMDNCIFEEKGFPIFNLAVIHHFEVDEYKIFSIGIQLF